MSEINNLWDRVVSELKEYGDEPHDIKTVWATTGYGSPARKLKQPEIYDFFVNQPDGSGFGGTRCKAFHLYSKNVILFMGVYDGAEWVESIPRSPRKVRDVEHVGG